MPESKSDARYKWVMLALLAFTYFLMHATRQVFNSSLTDIKAALPGPTDAERSFLPTVSPSRSLESRRTCSGANGSS